MNRAGPTALVVSGGVPQLSSIPWKLRLATGANGAAGAARPGLSDAAAHLSAAALRRASAGEFDGSGPRRMAAAAAGPGVPGCPTMLDAAWSRMPERAVPPWAT